MAFESLTRSINRVTIRTTATPDIVIDDPFGEGERGPSLFGPVLDVLRPSVYVQGAGAEIPIEPWGKPVSDYTPVIAAVTGLLVAGIGYLAYRGLKDVLKKR